MKKLLFVTLLSSFFLVACGGGEGGSASAETPVSEDLTQTELEAKFNLPPEPDPEVNNATIDGVDSDTDEIRDDWQRAIVFEHYKDPTMMNLHNLFAVNIARSNNAYANNDGESYVNAQMAIKEIIDCSYHLYGLDFKSNLFYLSKNTEMRDDYMLDADSKLGKYLNQDFYEGYSDEYLDTACIKYKK